MQLVNGSLRSGEWLYSSNVDKLSGWIVEGWAVGDVCIWVVLIHLLGESLSGGGNVCIPLVLITFRDQGGTALMCNLVKLQVLMEGEGVEWVIILKVKRKTTVTSTR